MGVGIVLPLERFVMLSMVNDQTTQANGELTQPSPVIMPPPTSTSDKTAYGVEYAEEIKGHGAIERIVQKWPVVRMDFRVFFLHARLLLSTPLNQPVLCLLVTGTVFGAYRTRRRRRQRLWSSCVLASKHART